MGPYIQKLIFPFFLSLLIVFSGCSNNVTAVQKTDLNLIFDYSVTPDEPQIRMSVFLQPSQNSKRAKSIRIKSPDDSYEWEATDLINFQEYDNFFSGFTNFCLPEGLKFPQGVYNITYTEADQSENKISASLYVSEDFYKLKAADFNNSVIDKTFNQKLAVYDENSNLLYYGENNSDFNNTAGILKKYKKAESKQIIWTANDNSIIALMPLQKLNDSNKDN